MATIEKSPRGGLIVTGGVRVESQAAGRVLVDLPEAAGPRRSFAPDATARGEIDSHGFSEFRNPYGRILTHWIANRSELEASEPPMWTGSAG